MKVLLADDEKSLAYIVAELFASHKIDADIVHNGEDAVDYALTGLYDVIILDIMMPKMSGIEALKILRKKALSTPIIMLSAKSEVADKVEGLTNGADDYLAKPFDSDELIARVLALARRQSNFLGATIKVGSLKLNCDLHEISSGGQSVSLTRKEFNILEVLMRNPKSIISKDTIAEKIWGFESDAEYNNVEVYISFLRKKITAICSDVQIKSVRGIGYRIVV